MIQEICRNSPVVTCCGDLNQSGLPKYRHATPIASHNVAIKQHDFPALYLSETECWLRRYYKIGEPTSINLHIPPKGFKKSIQTEMITKQEKRIRKLERQLVSQTKKTAVPDKLLGCDSYLMFTDEKSRYPILTSSSPKEKERNELLVIDLTERLSILTAWQKRLFSKQPQSPNGQTKKEIDRIDKLIAQLEEKQLAASSESKQPTSSSTGYEEVEVPGDGHCLYTAVGLYVGQDQKQLQGKVADELEVKLQTYEPFLELKSQQTSEQYIESVRSGSEWAGNAEIMALMHLLQRPIIVVRPGQNAQARIQNLTEAEKKYSAQKPILVKYNGTNHYNALVLVAPQNITSNTSHTQLLNQHFPIESIKSITLNSFSPSGPRLFDQSQRRHLGYLSDRVPTSLKTTTTVSESLAQGTKESKESNSL